MKKIGRDMSSEQNREFWTSAKEAAQQVVDWPDWKRAGINTTQVRATAREVQVDARGGEEMTDQELEEFNDICRTKVRLTRPQKKAVALALKQLERACTPGPLTGPYSPEYVRERRAELLALLGIPEELWKEM